MSYIFKLHYIIYIHTHIYKSYDNLMRYECIILIRRIKNLSLDHKSVSGISGIQSKGVQRPYL